MRKVLVVDDIDANRDLLADILSDDFAVETAENGQKVIDRLEAGEEFSVILLDLMMPCVDGFGVLGYMKEHAIDCPVIIISGENSAEIESFCFDYGVTDFIAKPFRSKIVLKRVWNVIHLSEAKAEAEAANAAKTSFLFNMSHDIRTPMNAIMGFTDLLDKNLEDPQKARDYLGKIKTSSAFLLSLINNVLEMARIESGNTKLEENVEHSGEITGGLEAVFAERMRQKGLNFNCAIHFTSEYLVLDKLKTNEIYLNLISNAYKYTPEGGSVSFTVTELPYDRPGYTLVEAVVEDTGIGMSEEFLPHIFEDFSRETNTTQKKIEGTGLGMPIVKHLVDLMGGTITVESKLGEGSKFTVRLPHKIGSADMIEDEQHVEVDLSKLKGKHLLLAEDNDLNAEIAIAVLGEEGAGFVLDRAEDGRDCILKLTDAPIGTYDAILMDIQMPYMDGYEATRVIRQMNDAKKDIPIIAMTANAFDSDRKNALDAGMNGHIAKPVNVDQLMSELAKILL